MTDPNTQPPEEKTLATLVAGDRVILVASNDTRRSIHVERTTATQIVLAGGFRVSRRNGYECGSNVWRSAYIVIGTPEEHAKVRDELRARVLAQRISGVKWHKLPLDVLTEVDRLTAEKAP